MIVNSKMAEAAAKSLLIHGLFLQGLTEAHVNEAYKSRAKETHPDMGGTMEEFVEVDRAKHVLLEWLKRRPEAAPVPHGGVTVCPRCEGRTYIMSQRAFRAMRVQCPTCRGAGEIGVEQEKEGDRF